MHPALHLLAVLLASASIIDAWSLRNSPALPGFAVDLTIPLPHHRTSDLLLEWWRADGAGAKIQQRFQSTGPRAQYTLLRFTPNKTYNVALYVGSGSRGTQTLTTSCTGDPILDAEQALVEVISGRPTFELLMVDYGEGLAAVDQSGWAVWSSPVASGTWSQMPDLSMVSLVGGSMDDGGILHITALGHVKANASIVGLSHESRVDPVDLTVLSIQSEERNVTGLTKPQRGDRLVKWDPNTGSRTLYNLFDVFDPTADRGICSDNDKICGPPGGGGNPRRPSDSDDWTHANAAARGTRNNFIMSVRHLSAVVSFHADGSGVDWILSSEVNATRAPGAQHFTYDRPQSAQRNQHCARQLPNGNLLLFDNGDSRTPLDEPRYSRIAEYRLDRASGVASLVFEFVPMLNSTSQAYSFHAGSAARLANGNTVGGFVCDSPAAGEECSMMVYEANLQGHELARLKVPKLTKQAYRALPLESVGGERRTDVTT